MPDRLINTPYSKKSLVIICNNSSYNTNNNTKLITGWFHDKNIFSKSRICLSFVVPNSPQPAGKTVDVKPFYL